MQLTKFELIEEDKYTLIINLSNLYLTYLINEKGGILTDQEIEKEIQEYYMSLSSEDKEEKRKEMKNASKRNKIELENYQKEYPIQTYTGTHAEILNKFITFFVNDEILEPWEGFSNLEYFHIHYNNTLSQLEVCERLYEYPFIQIISHKQNKDKNKYDADFNNIYAENNEKNKYEEFEDIFSKIYIEHTEKHEIYTEKMYIIEAFEEKEFYWNRERLALQKENAKLRAQLVHEGLVHPNKIAKLLEDDEDTDLDSKI